MTPDEIKAAYDNAYELYRSRLFGDDQERKTAYAVCIQLGIGLLTAQAKDLREKYPVVQSKREPDEGLLE